MNPYQQPMVMTAQLISSIFYFLSIAFFIYFLYYFSKGDDDVYFYQGTYTNDFAVGKLCWFIHKDTQNIESMKIVSLTDDSMTFVYRDKTYSCSLEYAHNKLCDSYLDAKHIRNKRRYESGEFLERWRRAQLRKAEQAELAAEIESSYRPNSEVPRRYIDSDTMIVFGD